MKVAAMDPGLLLIRREAAFHLVGRLAAEHSIPAHCIVGRGRDPQVMAVRHHFWALLHDMGLSYLAIGAIVDRDHSTVIKGIARIREGQAASVRFIERDEHLRDEGDDAIAEARDERERDWQECGW